MQNMHKINLRFEHEPDFCQHEYEAVGTIDTERVDGVLYPVVLSECLDCGKEITWLGDEIFEEEVTH